MEQQQDARAFGRHLLLFDGVCGLCHGFVQVMLRLDRGAFDFASLQSRAAAAAAEPVGGLPDTLETVVLVANYRSKAPRVLTRSRAVLFAMTALGQPWRAAAGVASLLPLAILEALYRVLARHRYRVFGRREQCLMPRPEYRARFLDMSE